MPPKTPCENCGSNTFVHGTANADRKVALTRVYIDSMDGTLGFDGTGGTPVDIYVCDNCGMMRLFAVTKRGSGINPV